MTLHASLQWVETERINLFAPLGLASALGWLALFLGTGRILIPAICSSELIWSLPSTVQFNSLFAFVSPWSLMAGWLAMVLATMLPTIPAPLIHIQTRSFASVSYPAVFIFSATYCAAWMLAGPLLVGLAILLRLGFGDELAPFALTLVVLVAWHASPWKQTALNRCHALPRLNAYAPRAHVDAARCGATAAMWCMVSCWAVMLMALVVPAYHLWVMAVVTGWIWAERWEHPRAPAWRFRIPQRLARLVVQTIASRRRERTSAI